MGRKDGSKKSGGGGSPAKDPHGLVIRAIKNDPGGKEEIIGLVQQLGELRFGVKYIEELSAEQQRSWIMFNHSVNKAQGDYAGLVGLIERVIEEERDADLHLIQVKIDDLRERREADEARETALFQQGLAERQAWLRIQWVLVGLTVFCVLFAAAMIVVGASSGETGYIGGSSVIAGIAIGLVVKLVSGGSEPPREP
jgi:hypothetical protein